MLRLARREPETLVIGVDPDAAAMRAASDRASRKPARGGLGNALFLTGTLDEVPPDVDASFSAIRVTLPWGSLLRAALMPEPEFVVRVLGLLRPGGAFELMMSLVERDQGTGAGPLDVARMTELADAYRALGFASVSAREATQADVNASGSTWAKRLGIPRQRAAWVLRAQRPR